MPTVISMKRSDHGVPWGFRLQGGTDFRIPLSIKKVSSDSPAGISGLTDGDIILQINGVPSTEITHQQGINMIKSADLVLDLVAERQQASIIKPTLTPQKFTVPLGSELVLDAAIDGACQVKLGGAHVAGQPAETPPPPPKVSVLKLAPISNASVLNMVSKSKVAVINSAPKPFYR